MRGINTTRSPGGALRPAFFVLIAILLCGSAGCNRTPDCVIEANPRYSMNVVEVPPCFPPNEEVLSPTEAALIQQKGPPDFIRFWWLKDGEFITASDLSGKTLDVPQLVEETKRTWIYLPDTEIEFVEGGGWLEHPMTEKLELLCKYGDPSIKSAKHIGPAGEVKETWQWYDVGLIVRLVDDRVVSQNWVQGTGRGTYLGH